MIRNFFAADMPAWGSHAARTTISKLLSFIKDPQIRNIDAHNHGEMVYLMIYSLTGGMTCRKIHCENWMTIQHLIQTKPSNCVCWVCRWRRKRKLFLDISEFDHIRFGV